MPVIREVLKRRNPERYFSGRRVSNAMARRTTGSHGANNAQRLVAMLTGFRKKDERWYAKVQTDNNSVIRRVFWMDPLQRDLYSRYHDVVMNDTTYNTNRFKMHLNVTTIVDAEGATRVVACALLSKETRSDFLFVLYHLFKANGNRHPHVVVSDDDKAFESALIKLSPNTHMVNCLWHFSKNLSNISCQVGKEEYEKFKNGFWIAQRTITRRNFEEEWQRTLDFAFPDLVPGSPLDKRLQYIYSRSPYWAKPWVGTLLTLGIQASQRVEKAHHLIKLKANGNTGLDELFQVIQKKIADESIQNSVEYYCLHAADN
ncbi:zinc finger SWIM domain-containing protein 3 [Entomortierella parvispora]|uniref:Zinc finger SWIM domain-containing protein 3 n=1 Tax=Entomortierella parvispora TaxID=205924 RepID=A0A9P3LVJ0_9FUNG|nr:zinc finger SWIM domain-containing protein 3 [Entomortierella parvispora]